MVFDQTRGGLDCIGHFVDGAKGDAIKLCAQKLCARGVNFAVELKAANSLCEEGGLLDL